MLSGIQKSQMNKRCYSTWQIYPEISMQVARDWGEKNGVSLFNGWSVSTWQDEEFWRLVAQRCEWTTCDSDEDGKFMLCVFQHSLRKYILGSHMSSRCCIPPQLPVLGLS